MLSNVLSQLYRSNGMFIETEAYVRYISIPGGQHVVISLVVALIMQMHLFLEVLFQWIPLKLSMDKSRAAVDPKGSKQ